MKGNVSSLKAKRWPSSREFHPGARRETPDSFFAGEGGVVAANDDPFLSAVLAVGGGGEAELQGRQEAQRGQPPPHSSRQGEVRERERESTVASGGLSEMFFQSTHCIVCPSPRHPVLRAATQTTPVRSITRLTTAPAPPSLATTTPTRTSLTTSLTTTTRCPSLDTAKRSTRLMVSDNTRLIIPQRSSCYMPFYYSEHQAKTGQVATLLVAVLVNIFQSLWRPLVAK